MELTVRLEDNADVSLLKKILEQIKGIKTVEISEDKAYSWDEIENSDEFAKVMEQGENEYKNESTEELTEELLVDFFSEKDEIVIDHLLEVSSQQAQDRKVRELTPELLSHYFIK